jgi:D-threonate/D-erythronate kinase
MLKFTDISILADDLTGACDVAACFAQGKGTVAVQVSPEHVSVHYAGDAVINTQSRLLKPEKAREILFSIGKQLSGKPVIFKKIDAALRGSVGAELVGFSDGFGKCRIVLAPAIPRIGRTTKDRVIYDSGVPLHRTRYASDSTSPVDSANIARILKSTGEIRCEIPDVESDEDLRRIVEQSLQHTPVIFAGSIGLADALAGMIESHRWKVETKPAQRVMIVCGSFYQSAREQILKAANHFGVEVHSIDGMTPVNIDKIVSDTELPVIVRYKRRKFNQERMISDYYSRIAWKVSEMIRELKPDGLGIIGGETAFHLLRTLGVTRMDVSGRIEEVMAVGVLSDGFLAGRRFVTKGGSVGSDDAVIRMINHLKGIYS